MTAPRSRRKPVMRLGNSLTLLVVGALCACASTKKPDEAPTVKSLEGRKIDVVTNRKLEGSEEKTIAAYQEFLKTAPRDPQRPEAMRRLGDLEMDSADSRAAVGQGSDGAPDYRAAIAHYADFLKSYPKDPGNDRVLYQLARAYEQGGDLETSLTTLDRLVKEYPKTQYRDEAQFRRGEILFSMRQYVKAELAYETVLRGDTR